MPDKKLTDSEIVKALRSWLEEIRKSRQAYLEKVNEEHYPSMRYEYLLSDTICEINRLQADCENYKKIAEHQQSVTMDRGFEIKRLKEKVESLQAENERFKDYATTVEKEVEWYKDELSHSDKKVATKAYKEVFEKLKDKSIVCKVKLYGKGKFFPCLSAVTLHDIKSLEKELVGEDN